MCLVVVAWTLLGGLIYCVISARIFLSGKKIQIEKPTQRLMLSISRSLMRPALSMATRAGVTATSPFSTPNRHQIHSKPTIEEAQACPREFYEMDNAMIIKLSAEGIFEAIGERLIREIMAVDGCR